MTRQEFVCRLARYGRRRSWAALHSFSARPACSHVRECEPTTSTSSSLHLPSRQEGFAAAPAPRPLLLARAFCSWPAAATSPAPASSTTSASSTPPQSREGLQPTHVIFDPAAAAAEYERRLQEFLAASRGAPPPDRQTRHVAPVPATASFPRPDSEAAPPLVPPGGREGLDRAGTGLAGPALHDSKMRMSDLEDPDHGAATASTSSRLSEIDTETRANQPWSHSASAPAAAASTSTAAAAAAGAAAAAAAARERARAALRDVPAFSPSRSGCSSKRSDSSSGSSSTAAATALTTATAAVAAATAAAPPQPQPHPASPTPVDWREMLERARQLLGPRSLSGREMLTDRFSRTHTYLRISLTERCNLRCTYCMPDEGVALTPSQQLLTTAEIMRLARLFVEAGVTKVRLTGGEPTLRRDIVDLVRQLGALRPVGLRSVAITSNGIVLARQLPALKEAGLTAINISLDSLRPERFERLARRPGHKRVMESIRTALELGYDPVKVNVVVMRGVNDDEVADFAALTRHQAINVRFIEYMPFDGNVWSDSKMVPYRELVSRIQSSFPDTPLERLDDPAGEVAKNFRLGGHRGTVSFITSMTQHFCSDCNRLRLLADGNLKVCLFGSSEVSLRDAMRGGASDDDLRVIISAAVGRKRAAHAGMWELAASTNRPMITIGG